MAEVINIIGGSGGVANVNLSYLASPIDGTIENSAGDDAIIPLADGINAGLLSPVLLNEIEDISTNLDDHINDLSNPHQTIAVQVGATPHPDHLTEINVQGQLDQTENNLILGFKSDKINFKDLYQTGRIRADTDTSILTISQANTLTITLVNDILFVNEVLPDTPANKLPDFLKDFGNRVFIVDGVNTPLPVNTRGIFYVGINKLGTAVYQTAKIYDQDICYLARLIVDNTAGVYSIFSAKYIPDLAYNRINNRDRLVISSGYMVPSGAASISFGNRAVTYYKNSINYSNNKLDPNYLQIADSINPAPMQFLFLLPNITSLATSIALSTTINPRNWYTAGGAVGGTLLGVNAYQVYKLFVTVTGTLAIQTKASTSNAPALGINAIFANREDALAGLTSTVFPAILPAGDSIPLGTFYLRAGTAVNGSQLTDPNDFYFLPITSSLSSSTAGVTSHDALSGKNDNPAFQHVTTTDITNWNNKATASGTVNKVSKFTAATVLGDSNLSDSGTLVTSAVDMNINGARLGRGGGDSFTNTTFGNGAFNANTSGTQNVAVGYFALSLNSTGSNNTALGYSSLKSSTGQSNTGIGSNSLLALTTGGSNTAVGSLSLTAATDGINNTAVGFGALQGLTSGTGTIGLGMTSGRYLLNGSTANISPVNSIYIGSGTKSFAASQNNEIVIGVNANGNGSNTVTLGDANILDTYLKGNVRGITFIKTGGLDTEILAANGSVITAGTNITISGGTISSTASGGITGSGTVNTIPKFTAASVLGNSNISDSGTLVTIATDTLINGITAGRGLLNDATNTAFGLDALKVTTAGGTSNTAFGNGALSSLTSANSNTAIGFNALRLNVIGPSNVAVGTSALSSMTSGSNVAVGAYSMPSATSAFGNTAIGYQSLTSLTTASSNVAVGNGALQSTTTGAGNIGIGVTSGRFLLDGSTANATSSNSIYLGAATRSFAAGQTNEIVIGTLAQGNGSNTITLGHTTITDTHIRGIIHTTADANINGLTVGRGLGNITTNTVLGAGGLFSNTTGLGNVAIGSTSLLFNTTGSRNTAVGQDTLANTATADDNTAIGKGALNRATTSGNTAIGADAGRFLTNGASANSTPTNGTYLGTFTKASVDGLTNEVVIGYNAVGKGSNTVTLGNDSITNTHLKGVVNTTADAIINGTKVGRGSGNQSSNTVIGFNALNTNSTGVNNTSIGYRTLFSTTGNNNVAIGFEALRDNINFGNNTAIGVNASAGNTTGFNNVSLGYGAGLYLADGSTLNVGAAFSIYVGDNTKSAIASSVNEIVIGSGATGNGSNTVTLGGDGISNTYLKGNVNGRFQKRVTLFNYATPFAPNIDTTDILRPNNPFLTGPILFNNPTGTKTEDQMLLFDLKDNNVSPSALTWGTDYVGTVDYSLPSTTILGKWIKILFMWNSTLAKWECISITNSL